MLFIQNSKTFLTFFVIVFFLITISIGMSADDKHKPSAPSKPAPQAHSQSGGSGESQGNSGKAGSAGRPSNASTGRPGNGSNGRPGNNSINGKAGNNSGSGRPSSSGNSSGRPGSKTNSSTSEKPGGNLGSTRNSGGPGRNASSPGGPKNNPGPKNARGSDIGDRSRSAGVHPNREPVRNSREVAGRRVATDGRGRVREINGRDSRGRDLAVHRDLHGGHRFETRGPGGRRVVGFGHGRGFTERRFVNRGGHVYVQRTYVYGGRRYAYAYRSYYYHGVAFYGYAPAFYYRPVFYGWAYDPWAVPVAYSWGWGGNPWYGYYGYYFTPYPTYASASLWLTDYLLAENLRAAYEARAEANADAIEQSTDQPSGRGQEALSPEVKQMIADEVQRQLAAERSAAAQPAPASSNVAVQNSNNQPEETPAALDPNQRVFVVAGNVDLVGDSDECTVTAGDVLVRSGNPNGTKVAVSVVSSKKGDCAAGTNADIEITELQEMHNQFREKMDSGLKTLADNSGKNGLPKAPDTTTIGGEVPPPQPDADATDELQNQQKDAESAEQTVQKGTGSPGGK